MGACLVQLIPHSYTDVGNEQKVLGFLKKSATQIEESFGVATICTQPEILDDYSYGEISFDEGALDKIGYLRIYLRRDFWQVEYAYHYHQIAINYNGKLFLRDFCCDLARALGATYSHYCDDCFIQYHEGIGETLNDVLKDVRSVTQRYPAEYLKALDWDEVMKPCSCHYDDYFD